MKWSTTACIPALLLKFCTKSYKTPPLDRWEKWGLKDRAQGDAQMTCTVPGAVARKPPNQWRWASFSVRGWRGPGECHQGLQLCDEGTHHVHRHPPVRDGRKPGRRTAGCRLHTPAPLGYRTSETLKSHGLWSRDPFKKRGLFSKWVFPKRGLRDGIFLAVWKEGLSEILGPYENMHCALLVLWKLNTRVMFTWLFGSDTTGYMNHQWQFQGGPQWPPTKWSC